MKFYVNVLFTMTKLQTIRSIVYQNNKWKVIEQQDSLLKF